MSQIGPTATQEIEVMFIVAAARAALMTVVIAAFLAANFVCKDHFFAQHLHVLFMGSYCTSPLIRSLISKHTLVELD